MPENWSLNEIATLSRKAARGAGLSWGLSEEAGAAVRWLSARGHPGPAALARFLLWRDGVDQALISPVLYRGEWMATGTAICPLTLGALVSDTPGLAQNLRARRVIQPLLLVPFVALSGAGQHVMWTDGADPDDPCDVTTSERHCESVARSGARADMSFDVHAQLEWFAARTYAPSTPASRVLGAGDGDRRN